MKRLFDRRPPRNAALYADAQALVDDGLDLPFVLDLFPDDADWLEPLLRFSGDVRNAAAESQPSYFFEASLRARLLAEADALQRAPAPAAPLALQTAPRGTLHTAAASALVVGAAAGLGALTLGFITAGNAVPGDWNYAFKLTQERLEYSLSDGQQRVNVQLSQTEARVYEIQQRSTQGAVSVDDLHRLEQEANELAAIARQKPLDDVQKARLKSIAETSSVVLEAVRQQRPELEESVRTTIGTVNDTAVAAGLGPIAAVASPTPAETATPTATVSPTATPSPTAAATATPSPTATATASASATATPPATATPDTTTTATATATPAATQTPAP
ncbi:MAG: hypothetical protein IT304_08805 [Dehalococcoidia bacterium]|nr:hypothetical protein [Dehalococcoidia bacterium]